nr:hypothetical protein HmN_000793100 [Hymenolepis microstoma]
MYEKDNNYIELECAAIVSEEILKASNRDFPIESVWDYLTGFLHESTPSCDQSPITGAGYSETPYLDVEFPIAHGYNLQVDDIIPEKVSNASHIASSKDLLRPSTRLLCRAGRSIVAEQYRRMNLGKVKLEGVKPKKMTEEALQRERELLQRTLPGAGVAIALLRWRTKDLGDLYEQTCVKEGCCYHSYSYEHLIKHLKMGHYVLEELLTDPEDDPNELTSPFLCFPINPLKMTDHGRNIYLCQHCNLSFGSQKSIVNHYLEMHNVNIPESNELNVFDTCSFCGELVEKESNKLHVCRLHLDSKVPKFMWNEIGKYLEFDPARGIGAHVLASLMLFPNAKSPLLMVKSVFDAIQDSFNNNLRDFSRRFMTAISAFRGSYHFCGQEPYKKAVCGILDIAELEKFQTSKRPHTVIDGEGDEDALRGQKKSRPSELYDMKKQFLMTDKSSIGESFERKKKVIVIQNRSEDGAWNSSPQKSPSILRIIHSPRTTEAGHCQNAVDVRSNVVVVTESKTMPVSSSPSSGFPANESAPSKLPPVLPRVLPVSQPSSGSQRPIVVRVSNPSDGTKVTSALDTAPRMSTQTADGLSSDLVSKSRLVSKIMGMNPVQSFGPPTNSNLSANQIAPQVSGKVEKKTAPKKEWESVLARNVAEEVAKKIAQKSSVVVPKVLPRATQTSLFQSNFSPDNVTRGPSNSIGYGTKLAGDVRRRQRRRIDLKSNSEDDPGFSYPFESPEAANLIKTWLKRSGTDVSKVKPSELPREIAALFGLKESNVAKSIQKNSQVHKCKYCGLTFEKLEILWAHCVRHHLKDDFIPKSPPTTLSTSGRRRSVGSSTFNVAKGSKSYPLKLTSRFSVGSASLAGMQTAEPTSSFADVVSQNETPKGQEKSNPSSGVNENDSKSIDNESCEISLMCPLCKFSSTSRDAIMEHVIECH